MLGAVLIELNLKTQSWKQLNNFRQVVYVVAVAVSVNKDASFISLKMAGPREHTLQLVCWRVFPLPACTDKVK